MKWPPKIGEPKRKPVASARERREKPYHWQQFPTKWPPKIIELAP